MVGFSSDLAPAHAQVGIDKLEISVAGSWVSPGGTGAAMFRTMLNVPDADWFNQPQTSRNGKLSLGLSQNRNRSTISKCDIHIYSVHGDRGQLKVTLSVNPTRTLAHLIARFDEGIPAPSFRNAIATLSPSAFFSRAARGSIDPSLDGSTNWLPAPRHVRERLGDDYWDYFVPVFCDQLRCFTNSLLMEAPVEPLNEPVNRISSSMGEVALNWSEVRVSTVESYFERYHPQAIATVRRGGSALLAADHSINFWRYIPQSSSFHRENDRFSVVAKLSEKRRLAIYAKRRDRLRFEIRRKGKGDYSSLSVATDGTTRLSEILQLERRLLPDAVRWGAIGELFAGPDHPQIGDVGDLIAQVCGACTSASEASQTLETLLFDGVVTETNTNSEVIDNLLRRGIVKRYAVRRRDRKGSARRYTLVVPYLDVHLALIDEFRDEPEQE